MTTTLGHAGGTGMTALLAWVEARRAAPAEAAAARGKAADARRGFRKHAEPLLAFIAGAAAGAVTYKYAGFHCMAIPVGGMLCVLWELAAPLEQGARWAWRCGCLRRRGASGSTPMRGTGGAAAASGALAPSRVAEVAV